MGEAEPEDKIIELGPHINMTVEQCLQLCLRQHKDFHSVMVIGWDHDGDLMLRSSAMKRHEANWLLDAAKQSVINRGNITMHGGPFEKQPDAEENKPA